MKREDTKQRILTEALKLFSVNGYEAVTVEQIATAVGVKAPSLYKHYKSKRDIFDSIVERMNEMDLEQAKEYDMPEGTLEETAEAYRDVPLEKVRVYTKAMFLYWTEEEFSSCFRKLLTLEQYRDAGMARLYQQYLSTGPLEYMTDIFRSMSDSDETARQLALEFYGPIYLLYGVYDDTRDRAGTLAAIDRHLDRFTEHLEPFRGRRGGP